jgi:hypothetical protein
MPSVASDTQNSAIALMKIVCSCFRKVASRCRYSHKANATVAMTRSVGPRLSLPLNKEVPRLDSFNLLISPRLGMTPHRSAGQAPFHRRVCLSQWRTETIMMRLMRPSVSNTIGSPVSMRIAFSCRLPVFSYQDYLYQPVAGPGLDASIQD